MEFKTVEKTKKVKKNTSCKKRGFSDKEKEKESEIYSAGPFERLGFFLFCNEKNFLF